MTTMDSRWSWIICCVAFIGHMLTIGFSYTVSVYYVEFLSVFNKNKGDTAWVSALNYGALCVIGKLLSIIIPNANAKLYGN